MDDIKNVKAYIASLSTSITNLSNSLLPLQNKSLSDILADKPSSSSNDPVAQIQVLNNYSYVLVSTLYSYLKTIGVDVDAHPIKDQLNRVKTSMARYKALQMGKDHEDELEKKKEEEKRREREHLSRTLGVRDVGAAADQIGASAAISKVNFEGKHTKFDDDGEVEEKPKKDDKKVSSDDIVIDVREKKKAKKSKKEGKVSKPKKVVKKKVNKK
ncbi:LRP1 Exosome complex protein LRP1 [Candida maltosa Xu316]|uniref:Exosome complex protein n=1 Tax=Candida maltosa (strain Xu316) TaxID=1245528 RepID=M3IH46_CANMX|nr:Nuclear cofactor protein [Candida maltosa Xu316]